MYFLEINSIIVLRQVLLFKSYYRIDYTSLILIRLLAKQLFSYNSNFFIFQRKRLIVATISKTSSNRNKHISERRDFDVNFGEFISKNSKALKKVLDKSLKNIRIENRRLRKKRELIELRVNNNTLRDSNSSAIIVETIAISSTIASVINTSIKAKTLRLDRIYLYKSNSEEEYLR